MKNESSSLQSTLRELNSLSPKKSLNKENDNCQENSSDNNSNNNIIEFLNTNETNEKVTNEKIIKNEPTQIKSLKINNFDNESFSVIEQNLKNTLKDVIDEFRDELMNENFKFKAEMIKEFIFLKDEINKIVKSCSINEELVSEVVKLKEENKRLKKMY